MRERAAEAARSIFSARSLAATASAVRRRGLPWLAAASAAARGPRSPAAAASAAARGPASLAASDRVPGPAFPAAVADPVVAVADPVAAADVAAECRLLVLDRSSVHVRPDARRAADCR